MKNPELTPGGVRATHPRPLALRRGFFGNLRKEKVEKSALIVPPPWWANPSILLAGFIIPVFTLVFAIPQLFGTKALQLRSAVYFTGPYFVLGLAFLFAVLAGCVIGQVLTPAAARRGSNHEEFVSLYFLEAVAWLTIGAYIIWFRDLIVSPKALVSVLLGDGGNIRQTSQTIGGVTTLTQCGLAYVTLYLDRVWGLQKPIPQKRFFVYFIAILGLGLFRTYAWAERLAMIELLVPIGLLFFCYRGQTSHPIIRLIRVAGPILGVAALIFFFGVMEFFRSWSAHYSDVEDSFWGFVMKRFLAYYYTALNNGSGLLLTAKWPTFEMGYVLSWLYRFPGLIGPIFRIAFDLRGSGLNFLGRYADPEFTNMSGIYTVYYDLGVPGGLAYACVWGCLAGAAYASIRARRGMLRLLYPLLFLSILETMRILYLAEPRAFPAVLTVVVGHTLFRARVAAPGKQHQMRRARRHETVDGHRWFRPRFGRFFGR